MKRLLIGLILLIGIGLLISGGAIAQEGEPNTSTTWQEQANVPQDGTSEETITVFNPYNDQEALVTFDARGNVTDHVDYPGSAIIEADQDHTQETIEFDGSGYQLGDQIDGELFIRIQPTGEGGTQLVFEGTGVMGMQIVEPEGGGGLTSGFSFIFILLGIILVGVVGVVAYNYMEDDEDGYV